MSALIKGKTGDWEMVIGLEVHAQVTAKAKLFSGASASFGGEQNTHVSFVDAGMPGMLPVLNKYAVEQAVRTGLGLQAKINTVSVFERKNYFYPDLPNGYQISQMQHPIVGKGTIDIDLEDGTTKHIGITRLHLEQDAGKSLHDQHPSKSYVDLNRAGVTLMEIVSEPDLRGPEEAVAYISKLRQILQYLGTCDGNMEEGSMRADVNLSVRKPGAPLGTRCEIKNVNSLKAVQAAIDYECERQIDIIEGGGSIKQETRLWDPNKNETRSMRSKEEAHDYRYFPDPDLLPLKLDPTWIEQIKQTLPELPDQKRGRFMNDYGLSRYDANVLIAEQNRAAFFETVAKGRDAKIAANWIITELLGALNKLGKNLEQSPVSATQLGGLLDLLLNQTISGKIAKDVFAEMVATGGDAAAIVADKGLQQVTDTGAVEGFVKQVIAAHADVVADYRSGNEKVFGFLVGQVMKVSGGKVNPGLANDILKKHLKT
jgi:aspartyl-tRNA(Asn)/glutamyl-tRNA(Gln) amidotransferase subunit B